MTHITSGHDKNSQIPGKGDPMNPRNAGRLIAVVLTLTLVAAACGDDSGGGVAQAECEAGQTDGDLAIFNWAEYIDQEELDAFAAEFGVGVTMDTYDSNEAMQPIISAGNSGYDLIVP